MAASPKPPEGFLPKFLSWVRLYGDFQTLVGLLSGSGGAFLLAAKVAPAGWTPVQTVFGGLTAFFGCWLLAVIVFLALHACGPLVRWAQRWFWPSVLRIEVHGGERATLTVHVEAGPPTATFRATAQLVDGDG